MYQELLRQFSTSVAMPIDVRSIADALVELGCQDKIILHPEELDMGDLLGAYVQYTTSPGVYSSPDLVTLIIYPSNAPLALQRLVCAKELVHLCDGKVAKTNTPQEVDALVERLLGKLSTDDYGLADLMATVDRMALYQALALLFPWGARERALSALAEGSATHELIAEWVELPLGISNFVLSDDWIEAYEMIQSM